MKNRKTLKKLILGGFFLLSTTSLFAQTQKVHTLQVENSSASTAMNSDALIQMDSNNKGLLLPRIALTGANQVAPLTAHTAGMVIYNTATVAASGTGAATIEAVTPGYYYNNGTKWVKIANTDTADITDDAWINNTATNVVELATKADGTIRVVGTEMVIKDDGYVGIGTTTPTSKLHINGSQLIESNGDTTLSIKNNLKAHTENDLASYITFTDKNDQVYGSLGEGSPVSKRMSFISQEDYNLTLQTYATGNIAKGMLFMSGTTGNVGIGTETPTEKLEVVGNGKFTGTVTTAGVLANSDKRFKQGIAPVTSAMQTVNKLHSVSYTWSALGKKKGGDNKKHIGFIAQEVEKVLPNLVNTDAKGYKSVNYIEVIPVLTKALQEQQKEIDELKAMVKKLLK